MTAEDVNLDISIAFDKLALTPQQQLLSYLCDHEPIILKAIKKSDQRKNAQTFIAFMITL